MFPRATEQIRQRICKRFQPLCLRLDHIFMDGVAGKVSNALDTVRGILGGILPQLEGEHVDIVNRFLCGFLCLNKRTLQLNVLELELVEFLAHGGQFVCFCGISASNGRNHAVVERLEERIEVLAALALTGSAFKNHGLRQLTPDLYDRVQTSGPERSWRFYRHEYCGNHPR